MTKSHPNTLVEIAANRLVIRAILAHLIASGSGSPHLTLASLKAAIDSMANSAVPPLGMTPEVQAEAAELVRKRALSFFSTFRLPEKKIEAEPAALLLTEEVQNPETKKPQTIFLDSIIGKIASLSTVGRHALRDMRVN